MARNEVVTMTNMCMVYQDNKVLVQDKIDPKWKGITFPGGHVEKGEAFTDAVIREVYEETGLTIVAPQLCGIKDWTNEDGSRYIVLLYKTNLFEGNLKSSDEGNVFWMELENLSRENVASGFMDMLEIFMEDSLSEIHYYLEDGEWYHELK